MNALYEQHVVLVEFQRFRTLYPAAKFKRVGRYVHHLSGKKAREVGIKPLEVEGVQAFIVIVSSLVAGSDLPVHEIIVERNHLRHNEVGHKLNRETLGRRCLAR